MCPSRQREPGEWPGPRRPDACPRVYVKPGESASGNGYLLRLLRTDETCVPCEDAITSNQVAQVRSVLRGSVIGWLDKNVGECFVTCPVTYEKTLDALFNTSNGNYTRMYPLKDTSYKRKKHGAEDLLKNMTTEDRSRVRANQLSTDGTLDATHGDGSTERRDGTRSLNSIAKEG